MKNLHLITIGCLLVAGTCTERGRAQGVPTYAATAKGEFIREWLVCGPFPNVVGLSGIDFEHGIHCTGFFDDLLAPMGGERNANPVVADSFESADAGAGYVWRSHVSETDLISFESIFDPKELVVGYAFCRIEAEQPERAILAVGSNDGIRVFLNGDLVHDHHISRWLLKDSDYVPIELHKGTNRLLVKVDEGLGDWGFCARLLDFESTIENIEENIDSHRKLSVTTSAEELVAYFGQPYKIETLNPGAKVTIEARDEGGKLRAMLSGPPGKEIAFPVSSFEEGPLHFRATFPLPDGQSVTSERGHMLGRLPRHEPPEMLRSDLAMQKNGEPFFPIGTYGANPEDYEILAKVGYNFVVTSLSNLDKVHEAGLLASVGFHGDDEAYLKHLGDEIREYKDHPAVLCWMLADEPGYNRMDLHNMHRAYELVREIDPVHPSYLVITDPRVYSTFGRCCDVLAVDTYPISKSPPAAVGTNLAVAYRASDGDLPIWHCGQMFDWPADRLPTIAEHRFMTYLSLLEGAKGMLWFTYRWRGVHIPTLDPRLWEAHEQILGEIKTLEPFLIAEGLGTRLKTDDDSGTVRAVLKTLPEGRKMVIALNTSETTSTKGKIRIPKVAGRGPEVLNENRRVPVVEDWLEDLFEPLAVHVYLWD